MCLCVIFLRSINHHHRCASLYSLSLSLSLSFFVLFLQFRDREKIIYYSCLTSSLTLYIFFSCSFFLFHRYRPNKRGFGRANRQEKYRSARVVDLFVFTFIFSSFFSKQTLPMINNKSEKELISG